jgi:hypothetical protein
MKLPTGPNLIKPFTSLIYECSWQAFQPSLMFVVKAGAYPNEVSF